MRKFDSIASFLQFAARLPAAAAAAERKGLEAAGAMLATEAKAMIGEYQDGWDRLSSATLDGFFHPLAGWIPGKIEVGYALPDNPLLRRGDLRGSYSSNVSGNAVMLGSPDPVALWQELGTPNAIYPIPPRSVTGLTMERHGKAAADVVVGHMLGAAAGLSGPVKISR